MKNAKDFGKVYFGGLIYGDGKVLDRAASGIAEIEPVEQIEGGGKSDMYRVAADEFGKFFASEEFLFTEALWSKTGVLFLSKTSETDAFAKLEGYTRRRADDVQELLALREREHKSAETARKAAEQLAEWRAEERHA